MRDCPVIESEGRAHPLDLRPIGRRAERRIEDEVAAAVRTALAEGEGGVLAFLPGVAEIERTAERLDGLGPGVVLQDRTRVVSGKSVSVRVALGGRRLIPTNNTQAIVTE